MTSIAFLVSCEEYECPSYENLVGVEADTAKMKQVLIDNCGCSEETVVLCTTGAQSPYHSKSSDILKMLRDESAKRQGEAYDICYFFFSGHGFHSGKEALLVASDTNPEYGLEPISVKKVANILKTNFPQSHIVLFIDVCQTPFQAKSPKLIDEKPSIWPNGVIEFYSCQENKESYILRTSNTPWGFEGSIFTNCLVRALDPSSGNRTVSQVSNSVKVQVAAICKSQQLEQEPHTALNDDSLGYLQITHSPIPAESDSPEAKARTEVEHVLNALVQEHPDVCDYSFVRDIHFFILSKIDDPLFQDALKVFLRTAIRQIQDGSAAEYRKTSLLTRGFVAYYSLAMYFKRNHAHWGDQDSLEHIVTEYAKHFSGFILNLEVLSWYCRRSAELAASSVEKQAKFKEAYKNDKKMMQALTLEQNAGVYASFASTVGRSLEALYDEPTDAISPWESAEERDADWKRACDSFEGEHGIIESYKRIWKKPAYGKHYYLWGKLLMYQPHLAEKTREEQIQILSQAKNKFHLAESAEARSTSGKEVTDRKAKISNYIQRCSERISALKKNDLVQSDLFIHKVTSRSIPNKRAGLNKPNEDSLELDYDNHWGIFVVADGVTRPHEEYAEAGEAAKNLAVNLCRNIVDYVVSHHNKIQQAPEQSLRELLIAENSKLAQDREMYLQQGTYPVCATLVMAFISGSEMYYFNCCDTVGYLIRNELKIRFTEHQNWLSDLHGNPKEEVYAHIQNNKAHPDGFGIINGDSRFADFVHIGHLKLEKNDRIVIASDGLSQYLKATRGAELVASTASNMIRNSSPYDMPPYSKYADDKTCIVIDLA